LSSCKKEPERDHSSTLEQYNVEEVIFTHPKSVDESKKILDYLKINNNYTLNQEKVNIYLAKTYEENYILVISPLKMKYDTYKIEISFPEFSKIMEEVEKYNDLNESYHINYFEVHDDNYKGIEIDLKFPYEGPYNFTLPIGYIDHSESKGYVYLYAKSSSEFVLYYYEDFKQTKPIIMSEFTI